MSLSYRKLNSLGIRSVRHLCLHLGTSRQELDSICAGIRERSSAYYRRGVIISKKGKRRPTATPYGRFRKIINRLHSLLQRLTFPENMQGGLKGHSTRTFAKPHANKACVLKSDMENCFPNIRPGKVYKTFISLGCAPDVAHYLTTLTTLDGELPQGSPTSTILVNLMSVPLAIRLDGLAKSMGGSSGTFVDDIILSGPAHTGRFKPTLVRIIRQEGFHPNLSKTVAQDYSKEQVVAGIRVNRGLDAPSEKIKEIRKLVQQIDTDLNSGNVVETKRIRSLRGKIRYVAGLNRGAGKALSKILRRTLADRWEYLLPVHSAAHTDTRVAAPGSRRC